MDSEEKLAIKLFWWLPVLTFILGVASGWLYFNPIVTIIDNSCKANASDSLEDRGEKEPGSRGIKLAFDAINTK